MADNIQTMIPRYGELNRIYRDYIDNSTFSFDRQKFISDFCQQYNDMKSFEAAILELVLDRQKEQYTLILNSLKTEIEKSIQAYEVCPLSDNAVERACYQHMERYSLEIEAQLDVTRSLSKPLNEANNRYDSIGFSSPNGRIYSEEHRRKFDIKNDIFRIEKSSVNENKLVLTINKQPIGEWFKEQWEKLRRGLRQSEEEPRKSRGFRI